MRFFLFLFLFLFSFLCANVCLGATAAHHSKIESADSVIVIDPFPGTVPRPGPKMPALVPISVSLESLISTLFMTFTSNLGEIEVEVMNTTTGDYISEMIDTQFLSATVPITMGPGHYLILFTLPSGRQYKGEFDL